MDRWLELIPDWIFWPFLALYLLFFYPVFASWRIKEEGDRGKLVIFSCVMGWISLVGMGASAMLGQLLALLPFLVLCGVGAACFYMASGFREAV